MAINQLYDCKNEGATFGKLVIDQTTGKVKMNGSDYAIVTDVPGACFGYSFDWARRMLTGEPKVSKPSAVGAVPLQQYYEIKLGSPITHQRVHAALRATVANSGYQVGNVTRKSYKKIAEELVRMGDGVSIFKMNIHWVGGGWRAGVFYFFDSNFGLYSGGSAEEMYDILKWDHGIYTGDAGYTSNWDVFEIKPGTD